MSRYNYLRSRLGDDYIPTDDKAARLLIDSISDEIWNRPDLHKMTFLDVCCKSGLILKVLRDKLIYETNLSELIKKDGINLSCEEYILKYMIYGLSPNEECASVSRKILYGSNINHGNIKVLCIKDYKETFSKYNKDKKKILNLINEIFKMEGDNSYMKFDVIITNPPYQLKNKPLYDKFIDLSMDLEPSYINMIVMNNWYKSETLEDIRKKMAGYGLRYIKDYPVIGDVFSDIGVAVSIIDMEKGYKDNTEFITVKGDTESNSYNIDLKEIPFVIDEFNKELVTKINYNSSFRVNCKTIYGFGISTTFRAYGKVGDDGKRNGEISHSSIKNSWFNTKVLYINGRDLDYEFINSSDLPTGFDMMNKYKVLVGQQLLAGDKVISSVYKADKGEVCNGSMVVMYAGDTEYERDSVYKYIKTKFFRYLTSLLVDGVKCGTAPYRFSLVPNQDFTEKSNIDWSQSIEDIDKQLYNIYNLTDEQIKHINTSIRALV